MVGRSDFYGGRSETTSSTAAFRESERKGNLDGVYEISGGITTTIAFLRLKALNNIKKTEYVTLIYVKNEVIDGLQEACDDECAGCYEGYLDDASEKDKNGLGDMLTATFVQWAKERGIKYWVDIPVAKKDVLYNLKSGKPLHEDDKNVWLQHRKRVSKKEESK